MWAARAISIPTASFRLSRNDAVGFGNERISTPKALHHSAQALPLERSERTREASPEGVIAEAIINLARLPWDTNHERPTLKEVES